MDVNVLIHLEAVTEEHQFVWWAESPELPGFTASADDLPTLLRKCGAVVRELAGVEAKVRPLLVRDDETARAHGTVPSGDQPSRGAETRQTHRTLVAA
jgi:hypothetical protein